MEIKDFAKKIGIPYLIHFTKGENIDGIFQNGLLPKILIEDLPYEVSINDEIRLDGHEDSVSLSIAFPNYKMFYKYRLKFSTLEWVVLAVHPSVLWEYECAFCKYNAADHRISCVPKEKLKKLSSFKSMFTEYKQNESLKDLSGEEYRTMTREDRKLKAFDPTDPQAEVLVFDIIPVEKIFGAAFINRVLFSEFKQKYPSVKAVLNQNYFSSRSYVRS
jgi:hypothetical protein